MSSGHVLQYHRGWRRIRKPAQGCAMGVWFLQAYYTVLHAAHALCVALLGLQYGHIKFIDLKTPLRPPAFAFVEFEDPRYVLSYCSHILAPLPQLLCHRLRRSLDHCKTSCTSSAWRSTCPLCPYCMGCLFLSCCTFLPVDQFSCTLLLVCSVWLS